MTRAPHKQVPDGEVHRDRERFETHLKRREYYPYPGPPGIYDITRTVKRGRLMMTEVRFPSPLPSGHVENDTAMARLFHSPGRCDRQPILFLPGFGPFRTAGWESFVMTLAARGFPTLLLTPPYLCERALRGSRRNYVYMSTRADVALPAYEQAVSDARAALDWLTTKSEVAGKRAPGQEGPAVAGVSFGALLSIIVGALEPGFDSVISVLGGGDLDTIVFEGAYRTTVASELEEANIQRESRLIAHATYEDYLEEIRKAEHPLDVRPAFHFFLFDPLTFASHLRRKRVLMANALLDPIIPRKAARQLWLELGRPEIHWFWGTHWAGGPWKPYVIRMIDRFLAGSPRREANRPESS
jgi:hypothetical protein